WSSSIQTQGIVGPRQKRNPPMGRVTGGVGKRSNPGSLQGPHRLRDLAGSNPAAIYLGESISDSPFFFMLFQNLDRHFIHQFRYSSSTSPTTSSAISSIFVAYV